MIKGIRENRINQFSGLSVVVIYLFFYVFVLIGAFSFQNI